MNGISNNAIGFSEVISAADAEVYNVHYLRIKHLIRDLRLLWEESNEPIEAIKDLLLAQWIPLSNNFTVRYDKELVPYDVCFAINDVRKKYCVCTYLNLASYPCGNWGWIGGRYR